MDPEKIIALREKLGITQRELAEKLGITVHAVRKWEQGKRQIKGAALKLLQELEK